MLYIINTRYSESGFWKSIVLFFISVTHLRADECWWNNLVDHLSSFRFDYISYFTFILNFKYIYNIGYD